jgi:hypothetical protein
LEQAFYLLYDTIDDTTENIVTQVCMATIQEVFLESDWEDAREARQKRDERLAELQNQGLVCTPEDLYNIADGRRVFLVSAMSPGVERESRSERFSPRGSAKQPQSPRSRSSLNDRSDESTNEIAEPRSENPPENRRPKRVLPTYETR